MAEKIQRKIVVHLKDLLQQSSTRYKVTVRQNKTLLSRSIRPDVPADLARVILVAGDAKDLRVHLKRDVRMNTTADFMMKNIFSPIKLLREMDTSTSIIPNANAIAGGNALFSSKESRRQRVAYEAKFDQKANTVRFTRSQKRLK